MHETEPSLNKPPMLPQADLDHLDDRLERGAENRAEFITEEAQAGINQAASGALEFSDRLGINPLLTEVKTTEEGSDTVEVATSRIGNNSVEHFVTPEGEVTVITLGDDEGSVGEQVTIKHTDPGEILVGEQPITSADDAAKVEMIIRELSSDAGLETDTPEEGTPEESILDDTEEIAEIAEQPEKIPTETERSLEEIDKLHQQFIQNAVMPYVKAMGPTAGLVLNEIGITQQDFEAAINSKSLKMDAATMDAFNALARHGARPDSVIWRENPNTPSAIGTAARESRQLLQNLWETALRRPKSGG